MEAKRQLTAEEESIRRNTDCIYFLASPLTCKKGSECEFRHSEVARVNPRECWFWMNGNCLNPKCAFRHPPLDGLFENPRPPAGQYNNPNKQTIPCYYFQIGQCIKGDKCPFMHTDNASQQATTMPHEFTPNDPQDAAKLSSSIPSNSHTNSWGLKECTTQVTPPKTSIIGHSISTNKLDTFPHKQSSSYPLDYDLPKPQPISSDSTSSKPPPIEEHYTNGREAEDYLGESPGFDVLVDVDGEEYVPRDPEFYNSNPNLDQSVNEFDYDYDYDYGAVASYEKDEYNRQMHHRSMESTLKRRSVHRDLSPGGDITGSDLRHGLLKKRRVNGDHDNYHEREARRADYGYKDRFSRRNSRVSEEISISSRLQGRIKLPSNEFREREKRRNRGRSPSRSGIRDRIKHVHNSEKRRHRRDDVDSLNFPGPKSLAELKGAKISVNSETSMVKKDDGEDEVENFDENDGDYEYEGDDLRALNEENACEDENACLDDEEEFAKKVKGFFE